MSDNIPLGDGSKVIEIRTADEVRVNADESQVELWMAGHFAPAWFANAKQQSLIDDDGDEMAKPREIVFAVCAVESHLVEWVRDEVLKSDYPRLNEYFPIDGSRDGIVERWKNVIKRLAKEGAIPRKPDFGQVYWEEFDKLVTFRNGLVHGRASRPDSNTMRDERERPGPTNEDLVKMDQGWPVRVVAAVIRNLHAAIGSIPPKWLDI